MSFVNQIHPGDLPHRPTYCVACAIVNAAAIMNAGDVILIEQQLGTPTEFVGMNLGEFLPMEWKQAEFDAIQAATMKGITVVEAGGNGRADLDSPQFGGAFNRSVRDSGAIMVGGGHSEGRRWAGSSYGSRIDCQAWYEHIVTTGTVSRSNRGRLLASHLCLSPLASLSPHTLYSHHRVR